MWGCSYGVQLSQKSLVGMNLQGVVVALFLRRAAVKGGGCAQERKPSTQERDVYPQAEEAGLTLFLEA